MRKFMVGTDTIDRMGTDTDKDMTTGNKDTMANMATMVTDITIGHITIGHNTDRAHMQG